MFTNLDTLAYTVEQAKREVYSRALSCSMYLQHVLLDDEVPDFDKAETAGQLRAYLNIIGSTPGLGFYAVKMRCSSEETTKEQDEVAMKTLNKLSAKLSAKLER